MQFIFMLGIIGGMCGDLSWWGMFGEMSMGNVLEPLGTP